MDELTKQFVTYALAIIIYPLAFYIEYRIIKRLIKFGIDYYYEKRSVELRLKEAREDIKDIEADVKRHMEGDR